MGMFDDWADDIFRLYPVVPYLMRRPRPEALRAGTESSEVINDKDKFVVKLDVSHFKPEEIKVRHLKL